MLEKIDLSDRTVLITGGGSGLGLSMATDLYRRGATVIINGRNKEKLDRAVVEISSESGGVIDSIPADIRVAEEVEALFTACEAKHGIINGLVNNAAGNFLCCSESLTSNGFRAIVDIVLQGTFHCTRAFGSRLIEAGDPGAVVSIVTTYAETGSAFVLPSACAKAGVVALTKSLAFEWAEFGIRLNAVAPGPFPTKGAWERLVPDAALEETLREQLPMGRFGEHHELTGVVAFLLSDFASYMSGDVVSVDGAERLRAGQFNFLRSMGTREELQQKFNSMRPKKG